VPIIDMPLSAVSYGDAIAWLDSMIDWRYMFR